MKDRSCTRWHIFSALLPRNHIACIQESRGHEGGLVSLRKKFTSHSFYFNPHPGNLQGHGILACVQDKQACQFSGFSQKILYPGKAPYVLGWGEAGLSGIVAVHLSNVDAGFGYYRHCLSCTQSALLPAAAAAHIMLGDFNVVFSGEGRFNLDDGAFTRGGTSFTREWNAAFGSWTELYQPLDTRRACQGPRVVSTARLDRVYVDIPPA
eukprot:1752733-Pyramimonas_sp.AAC.2